MNRKQHWEQVYQTKTPNDVSWFQSRPDVSLKLIEATGVSTDNSIIDVGGGASVLVDFLLDAEFAKPSVLDISNSALTHAKDRLGERAGNVEWFNADVTEIHCSPPLPGLFHLGSHYCRNCPNPKPRKG